MTAPAALSHRKPPWALLALLGLLVGVSTVDAVVPDPWRPRPGDYVWQPSVAPAGPLVVVVSLPLQQLHVYRNGVRIGASSISSGKPGHETPRGVFTILQKHVEHYSNRYDNAPMPWMQRLTWDGIALHAGRLPGRPASHGCIRLPEGFAKSLFSATRTGDVVIVSDRAAQPGIAAGGDVLRAMGPGAAPPAQGDYWTPEASPSGPVSIVLSLADARLVVNRNGRRIGEAAVRVEPGLRLGTRAYMLLDGAGEGSNPVVPERPARRWMTLDLSSTVQPAAAVGEAISTGRLVIPADVARHVDDVLRPGATVLITDEPLGDARRERIELENDDARGGSSGRAAWMRDADPRRAPGLSPAATVPAGRAGR